MKQKMLTALLALSLLLCLHDDGVLHALCFDERVPDVLLIVLILGETVSQDLEFTDDLRVLAEHLIVGIVDFIHVIVDVGGKVTVAAGHLELMVPKILGCKHFHSPFVKDGHPEDGVPIL